MSENICETYTRRIGLVIQGVGFNEDNILASHRRSCPVSCW